jgi:hypothetical protein
VTAISLKNLAIRFGRTGKNYILKDPIIDWCIAWLNVQDVLVA